MKQRSPVAAALLSFFIPFYIIYWLYVVARDMKRQSVKVPNFLLLIGPVLAFLALALLQFILRAAQAGEGTQAASNIITLLVGMVTVLAIIILPLIYYYRFCRAAETATGGQVSGGLTFILMLVLAPVAVYLIQEKLNTASPDAPAPTESFAAPIPPVSPTSPTMSGQNPPNNLT